MKLFYRKLTCFFIVVLTMFKALTADEIHEALSAPYIYHSVNVMTGCYVESSTDLALDGAVPLVLRRTYQSQLADDPSSPAGWYTNFPCLWTYSDEGRHLSDPLVKTEYDPQGRLIKVTGHDESRGVIGRELTMSYGEEGGELHCLIKADDDTSLKYTYFVDDQSRKNSSIYLSRVEKGGSFQVSYEYQKHPLTRSYLISRRNEADGRYLIAEYYDQQVNDLGDQQIVLDVGDFRWGRVKQLKAPVGADDAPLVTHRFFYGPGFTEVRDALNHKIVYRYTDFHRLSIIEYYDEHDQIYRVEKFSWKLEPGLLFPLMTSRWLERGDGQLIYLMAFDYDQSGHLIKSVQKGCLTGNQGSSDNLINEYHYDDSRLVYKKEGEHLTVNYAYDSQKRLIAEHQFIDQSLYIRTFYTYDFWGNTVAVIVDDGSGTHENNMTGVSSRRVTRKTPSLSRASFGQPLSVEEFYWEQETQTEVLLSCQKNEYSDEGLLIRQQCFDALNACVKDLKWAFDKQGRLVFASDENKAVVTSEYDAYGNVVLEAKQQEDGSLFYKKMTYDLSNRLIKCEESSDQSYPFTTYYRYNLAGLKVSESCDGFGTISYEYDAWGRLIKILQPPLLNEDNTFVYPEISYEYDYMDNVAKVIDANGWVTTAHYNTNGKPIAIQYPDGTSEEFRYNLKGDVVSETNKLDTTTTHTRDGLGRPKKSETVDRQGRRLSLVERGFNSFVQLSQVDFSGNKIFNTYDGAGRLNTVWEENSQGWRKTVLTYDKSGRLCERKIVTAEGELVDKIEFNELDEPIAVATVNGQGASLHRATVEEGCVKQAKSTNGLMINPLGQEVRYSEETNEKGISTKTIFNLHGQKAELICKNPFGDQTSHVEFFYDAVGNKTKEVYYNTEGMPAYCLKWKYGIGNRLDVQLEGQDLSLIRKTAYIYNAHGQLSQMVKPDGIILYYHYFPSGSLQEVDSSDHTIHYLYEYDEKGNILCLTDGISGQTTKREYTANNQISSEKLANGLALTYTHNQWGQKTKIVLPDSSEVAYSYQGKLLKCVERLDSKQISQYKHSYDDYANGRLLVSTLAGSTGQLHQEFDNQGCLIAIKTNYWSETALYSDEKQIIKLHTEFEGEHHTNSYQYGTQAQLAAENGDKTDQYSYDTLGNSTTEKVDSLNQLLSQGCLELSYDLNGNLEVQASNGHVKIFEYDALNRMKTVYIPQERRIHYTYDGFNRRISKKSSLWCAYREVWIEEQAELYLYNGMCEIGSTDSQGKIRELRILGNGTGSECNATLAVELDGQFYTAINDIRGNIAALVAHDSGNLIETYRYTAYGERLKTQHDENAFIDMPWGYSGKRHDEETGWICFGLRYYAPYLQRWTTPDPLGHLDGPNKYAFVHNNPVMNGDFFGEFSVGKVWNSCVKFLREAFESLSTAVHNFQEKVSYTNYSKHEVEELANIIVGSAFLRMTGFYIHHAEVGVLGRGEVSDKVRITMINGILNIRSDYVQSVALFSKTHGDVNIHYVYRPSDGWAHDVLKCILSKAGVMSSQSHLLAKTWREMIEEVGGLNGGGLIIHYAHSIGGTETSNAKRLLTPEERKMIKIITFGSATLIPDRDFKSVVNYVSWRDGVSCFDPISYARILLNHDTNSYFINSSAGIPFPFDHILESASYAAVIKMLGAEFVRTYGSF